jgi:tetratricopeptide (TPR) repeat protein
MTIDAAALSRRMASEDLARIGVRSVRGLLCDLTAVSPTVPGARIQTDDGMHLEFLAPLGFYRRTSNSALEVLGDPDPSALARVVRGHPVNWLDSRRILREGVKARSVGMNRIQTLGLFLGALVLCPDDRQARWYLEERVDACLQAAAQHTADGKFKAAFAELDAVPPESGRYLESRVRLVDLLNRSKAGPEEFSKVYLEILDAAPGHEAASCELAQIFLNSGKLDSAAPVLEVGLARHPSSSRLHLLQGDLYAARKLLDDARREWQKASELDPRGRWGDQARTRLR